jgi:hypothetical protein
VSQSRLHCCCLVVASNGGHSPSSGFPNGAWPQLPASNSNSSQQPQQSSNYSQSKLWYNWWSVGQSILVSSTHLGLMTFFFTSPPASYGFVDMGRPLWREDGSDFYSVQYIYILHVMAWMYTQYIQGFCHSRLGAADYALSLVASAYEF